jgi:hypothetical protein
MLTTPLRHSSCGHLQPPMNSGEESVSASPQIAGSGCASLVVRCAARCRSVLLRSFNAVASDRRAARDLVTRSRQAASASNGQRGAILPAVLDSR